MKVINKKIIFAHCFSCALTLLMFLTFFFSPQNVSSQVSQEASRLLRIARIQVLGQQIDPHEFNLQLLNGGNVSLANYTGKVIILNFWATWCPPCLAEMPSMELLYQRYKSAGLEILAVNIRERYDTVNLFIQNKKHTFPVPLDINGSVSSTYGIEAIPTSFIIDRRGKIIGKLIGSIQWDTPQVLAAFEALLNSR
ncbi:MAG: TlpA family protein disulfide reductase [Treponema sp.]|nr:TlpA family protein disulfide reductase [Treponema sp.]MCL2251249.1 TlpA family protein disulfide reductase [Treponema sp.]